MEIETEKVIKSIKNDEIKEALLEVDGSAVHTTNPEEIVQAVFEDAVEQTKTELNITQNVKITNHIVQKAVIRRKPDGKLFAYYDYDKVEKSFIVYKGDGTFIKIPKRFASFVEGKSLGVVAIEKGVRVRIKKKESPYYGKSFLVIGTGEYGPAGKYTDSVTLLIDRNPDRYLKVSVYDIRIAV